MTRAISKVEIAGARFGTLTIIERVASPKYKRFRVRCDCGSELLAYESNLRRQKSCGCLDLLPRDLPIYYVDGTVGMSLGNGLVTRLDKDDFDRFGGLNWYWTEPGYVRRSVRHGRKQTPVYLHREILGVSDGVEVDHISCDTSDNRRCNLRLATKQGNGANRGKNKNNTSGFKGVIQRDSSWQAQVKYNYVVRVLGFFNSPEEAARAYDREAIRLFGEFARTNFPRSDYK